MRVLIERVAKHCGRWAVLEAWRRPSWGSGQAGCCPDLVLRGKTSGVISFLSMPWTGRVQSRQEPRFFRGMRAGARKLSDPGFPASCY